MGELALGVCFSGDASECLVGGSEGVEKVAVLSGDVEGAERMS